MHMELKEDGSTFNNLLKESGEDRYNEETKEKLKYMKFRIMKTIVMFLSWIALGFFSEMLGPSLPALKVLSNTDYEEIGRALAVRSVGLFLGSLIGGLCADVWQQRRDLLMCLCIMSGGLLTAVLPFCRSLGSLCILLLFHGMSHGGLTTSGNPLLNSLWHERSTGPFSFMHSGYGVGGSLAPLLLKLFDPGNFTQTIKSLTNQSRHNETLILASYIRQPCNIVALYCAGVSLIFLVYACILNPTQSDHKPLKLMVCRRNRKSVNIQDSSIHSDAESQTCIDRFRELLLSYCQVERHKRQIFIMLFAFIGFFGIVGNERIFGKFQFTYATESQLKIPADTAYLINGLYWMCFTLGRILTALIAIKVSPRILLIVEIFGALVCSTIFTIFNRNNLVFYLSSAGFGLFKSPLFPTLLGVLSLYGEITGALTMIVNFGSSAGAMTCQYFMGYLIEAYGAWTFPGAVTGTCVVLLVMFSILLVVAQRTTKPQSSVNCIQEISQ